MVMKKRSSEKKNQDHDFLEVCVWMNRKLLDIEKGSVERREEKRTHTQPFFRNFLLKETLIFLSLEDLCLE